MSQLRRISVGAVNIRCHREHHAAEYRALINGLASSKRSIRVHGDTHLLLYKPRDYTNSALVGWMAKFTQIDMEREWIDLDKRKYAGQDQLDQIVIPENLAPHGALLRYFLYPKDHLFVFQSYTRGIRLPSAHVQKFFERASKIPRITDRFGVIDSTVLPTKESLNRIFAIARLHKLLMIVRRPNADDLTLADSLFSDLQEQNAVEVRRELVADKEKSIVPNDETKDLATVARDNGHVTGYGLDSNGYSTTESTMAHPLVLSDTLDDEQEDELAALANLAEQIADDWRKRRKQED